VQDALKTVNATIGSTAADTIMQENENDVAGHEALHAGTAVDRQPAKKAVTTERDQDLVRPVPAGVVNMTRSGTNIRMNTPLGRDIAPGLVLQIRARAPLLLTDIANATAVGVGVEAGIATEKRTGIISATTRLAIRIRTKGRTRSGERKERRAVMTIRTVRESRPRSEAS